MYIFSIFYSASFLLYPQMMRECYEWLWISNQGNVKCSSPAKQHLENYLHCSEFNASLLSTQQFDHVVHAIYSFLLQWEWDDLCWLSQEIEDPFKPLIQHLMNFITSHEEIRIYAHPSNTLVPYIQASFGLLYRFFDEGKLEYPRTPAFNLFHHIDGKFVGHFVKVSKALLDGRQDPQKVRLAMNLLHGKSIDGNLYWAKIIEPFMKRRSTEWPKVITGQACCGKTTFSRRLEQECNIQTCSRGYLGRVAGGSIFALHASLENALSTSMGNVVGDGGALDDPLWTVIMPLCDSFYRDKPLEIVMTILKFFNSILNENVLAYLVQQYCAVFLDASPRTNRMRMLRRGREGDAQRARIFMYPIAQFIAYYVAACLLDYRICLVQFDQNDNLVWNADYEELVEYLRLPRPKGGRESSWFREKIPRASKVVNTFCPDNTYPINASIFE